MTADTLHTKTSHTRGVPLADLAGLCFILGEAQGALSVRELANRAITSGILESELVQVGKRLPTRINHRIISLRELELVNYEQYDGHVYYSLATPGEWVYTAARKYYQSETVIGLNASLRDMWRQILVKSKYVRSVWLKYFMPRAEFDLAEFNLRELISHSSPVTIIRVPQADREGSQDEDSGYRLSSEFWGENIISDIERREILQGLRRWTNAVYLTDDSVTSIEAAPFAHLSTFRSDAPFIVESFIVKAWLDPDKDLSLFEQLVNQTIDKRRQGNRINIPDLIIALSYEYGYAKDNLKEMLTALFYERRNRFFFERGSKFLVDNAFRITNKNKPALYYVNLEGSWRTSLVRYGTGR